MYERGLSLDDAIAYCSYQSGGVAYSREVFASYPDRVLVVHMRANKAGAINLCIRLELPFLTQPEDKAEAAGKRSGQVTYRENTATAKGILHGYNLHYEGRLYVDCSGGQCSTTGEGIAVVGADSVTLLFIPLTSYALNSHVFLEQDDAKKTGPVDVAARLKRLMGAAAGQGYTALRARHLADYRRLFARVALDLGESENSSYTDELLHAYAEGAPSPYLEALYFQHRRYLLIASSRPGTLPANLQGVWTCHEKSPWGSGFWHNINVQMNYWPAFNTNLCETFEAYASFNEAFRPAACRRSMCGKTTPKATRKHRVPVAGPLAPPRIPI